MMMPGKTLPEIHTVADLLLYMIVSYRLSYEITTHDYAMSSVDARCANVILAFKGDINEFVVARDFHMLPTGLYEDGWQARQWTVLMAIVQYFQWPLCLLAMGKRGDVNPTLQPNWDTNPLVLATQFNMLSLFCVAFPGTVLDVTVPGDAGGTLYHAVAHSRCSNGLSSLYTLLEHGVARVEVTDNHGMTAVELLRRRFENESHLAPGIENPEAAWLKDALEALEHPRTEYNWFVDLVRHIVDLRNSDEACAALVCELHARLHDARLKSSYPSTVHCNSSPLMAAIMYGRPLTIRALANVFRASWGFSLTYEFGRAVSPLTMAAMVNNGTAEVVLDAFPRKSLTLHLMAYSTATTALHMAAAWGNTRLAMRLLARGITRTWRDRHKTNAATLARSCRHYDTAKAIWTSCSGRSGPKPKHLPVTLRALVQDVIKPNKYSDEAIATAVQQLPDAIYADCGADVGNDCVNLAVKYHLYVTLKALAARADVGLFPANVLTLALVRAVHEKEMLGVMLQSFARHFDACVACPGEPYAIALQEAAKYDKKKQVQLLLAYSADTTTHTRPALTHDTSASAELIVRYDRCVTGQRFAWLRCIVVFGESLAL